MIEKADNASEMDDHDEVWLVSYADMVTLLMSFFVILYSITEINDEKMREMGRVIAETMGGEAQQEPSQAPIQQMTASREKKALTVLMDMIGYGKDIERGVQEIERLDSANQNVAKIREKIEAGLIKGNEKFAAYINKKGKDNELDIILPRDFLFQPGAVTLTVQARSALAQIAREIAMTKGLLGVVVTGHSDGSPSNKHPLGDNWTVSAARAGAVAQELIHRGVSPTLISTSGMGATRPLFPERDAHGRPLPDNMMKNRRVHITIKAGSEP